MTEQEKQILYRDARSNKQYDSIWQHVGKCVFCDMRDKYIFFEQNGIVMTISLYAYIDGHFMIVPRRHVTSVKELTQLEWDTIRRFMHIARKLIKDIHKTDGVQFTQKSGRMAQSTVEHIHFHCIPFDAPDLSVWNCRKLARTPLENVEVYKKARKKIIQTDLTFDKKYKNLTALPIVCDLLVVNEQKQILFQQRKEGAKLSPDTMTIPGGLVDDYNTSFESEMARKVFEETGWQPPLKHVQLVASRIAHIKRAMYCVPLKTRYALDRDFVWNTYIFKDFNATTPLIAADDCEALVWVNVADVAGHPRISDGIKETIAGLTL